MCKKVLLSLEYYEYVMFFFPNPILGRCVPFLGH